MGDGLDYLDIFVMFLQKAFKDLFFFNRFFFGGRAGYDNQIIQPLTFRMTGGALRQTSGHLILKSFQNFNKPGIPDYGIMVIIGKSRYLAVAAISRSCNSGMSSISEAVLRISKLSGSN